MMMQLVCNLHINLARFISVSMRLCVQGKELKGEVEGILAMKQSWPSMMRTLFGDHKRYEETYFSAYKVCLLCCALHALLPAVEPHLQCPGVLQIFSGGLSDLWTVVSITVYLCVCRDTTSQEMAANVTRMVTTGSQVSRFSCCGSLSVAVACIMAIMHDGLAACLQRTEAVVRTIHRSYHSAGF